MTAMMGLDTRLRLAKVAVMLPTLDQGEQLANLCDEMASASAAMVFIDDATASREQVAAAYEVALHSSGFDAIVGVVGDSDWSDVGVDAQLSTQATPRPHQWALRGRFVADEAALRAAVADAAVDFIFVPARLVALAAQLAPATSADAKPWFVAGLRNAAETRAAITQGACRVAIWVDRQGLGAAVEEQWQLVTQVWRRPQMQQATFAAFNTDAGQQRRPDQEPPNWSLYDAPTPPGGPR